MRFRTTSEQEKINRDRMYIDRASEQPSNEVYVNEARRGQIEKEQDILQEHPLFSNQEVDLRTRVKKLLGIE